MRARRVALICLALFALNALLCWPLFGIEYLDDFQSNEGSYITFGDFLLRWWPHVAWFPWFNAGMPFENTYLPLTAALVALVARVAHCSPAHAFHFVAALSYSLAPVFLFLFARGLSGCMAASAWAAVLWSVAPWGLRRLENIVVYGETPHNLALCLLPLALWLTNRYLDAPSIRRFGIAALAAAFVMLANAFGIVAISVSSLMLFAVRGKVRLKDLGALAGILLCAYLAICRLFPPTLIRLVETNSQLVGGDYRFKIANILYAGCFVAFLIALWALARRFCGPMVQFAILFSACFGGIAFLGMHGAALLPQPERYYLEMGAGVCLLAAFLLRALPRRILTPVISIGVTALVWVGVRDYRFARQLIHPADAAHALPFTEARWIAANLPGQRVLIAGEAQWLFNLFADNPQMGAGHEPSAPNWMQRVAVYTIYTGQNAGDQDVPISILWLQAFGCGAVELPGADSRDHYHAVANPRKFDSRLPLIWRAEGDSIYRVPEQSTSLAHVIPRSAIVTRRPIHGLDVDPIRPYVAALADPSIQAATLTWENPDHGRILAKIPPADVISVQVTWDPGWQARVAQRRVPLKADQLGFILIDPRCSSNCSIDLEFTGGTERTICLAISLLTTTALLAMIAVKLI